MACGHPFPIRIWEGVFIRDKLFIRINMVYSCISFKTLTHQTQKCRLHYMQIRYIRPGKSAVTVNSLNIRTPKKIVVITLKFELCGSTID